MPSRLNSNRDPQNAVANTAPISIYARIRPFWLPNAYIDSSDREKTKHIAEQPENLLGQGLPVRRP